MLLKIPKILPAENAEEPVENKKWLEAIFWQNWVNEKIVPEQSSFQIR
jgi:hypothetical protein